MTDAKVLTYRFSIEVAVMRLRTFSSFDLRSCTTDPKQFGGGGRTARLNIESLNEWTVAMVAPGVTSGLNPICVMETFASAKAALARSEELIADLRKAGNSVHPVDTDTSTSGLKPYLRRDHIAAREAAAEEDRIAREMAEMPPMPVFAAPQGKGWAKANKPAPKGNDLLDGLEFDD